MTVHREPTTGYTSDAKQEYREKVWKSFARRKAIHYANVYDNAFILIMPGLGTEEIDTAVDYGMDPEKIICVHESAAHVAASAKWRKKYPKTPFYCCKISEVMEKLVRDKRYLTGANLDFCNNLSPELIYEVQRFMVPGIIDSGFVLQINIMAARESKMATAMIDAHSVGMNAKMRALAKDLYCRVPANVDVDKFVADNTPVYGDIKCNRINALLGITSAIEIVSDPINCFVDMQGNYVNNKAPMSHVSVVIGYETRDARYGVKKNKLKEIKTHGEDLDERMSKAKEFISQSTLNANCEPDVGGDAVVNAGAASGDVVEINKNSGSNGVHLGWFKPTEIKNKEFNYKYERDTTGMRRDLVKLRSAVSDRIVELLLKEEDYTSTAYWLCSQCQEDMDWILTVVNEGDYFLSRSEIYEVMNKMQSDGVLDFDRAESKRWVAVKLNKK